MEKDDVSALGQGEASDKLASLLMAEPAQVEPETETRDGEDDGSIDNPGASRDEELASKESQEADGGADKPTADKEQAEPETAIEPPASWDAEAKAKFAKLDPELQQFIAQRETERDRGTQAKLQEAAELRKATEAERGQIAQLRTAYETQLRAAALQLEQTIPQEFHDIKSPADELRVAQEDPARLQRFNAWRNYAASIVGQMQQVENARQQEQAQQFQQRVQQESQLMREKLPDLADPKKADAIKTGIVETARQLGFKDDEIGALSDHRMVLLAHWAAKGMAAEKAASQVKAKIEAKPLPQVVKPTRGVSVNQGPSRAQAISTARSGDRTAIEAQLAQLLQSG